MVFGNLYEYVVLFPNLMGLGGIKGLIAFRNYFVYSNPAFYYILGWFGLVSLFIAYAKFRGRSPRLNKYLKMATIYGIISIVLTIIIVTQFNFRLFFGNLPSDDSNLQTTLLIYYVVTFIRLFFGGLTLYSAFRAYNCFKSDCSTNNLNIE